MRRFLAILSLVFLINSVFSRHLFHEEGCEDREMRIEKWVIRWELAKVLTYAEKYSEAEKQYIKLIEEKPHLYEADIELANVYLKNKDFEKALKILEQVPLGEIDDSTKLMMAEMYLREKDYLKAEDLYRKHIIL